MANISETEARLNSHEAVCAVRYEQINARLRRLEGILLKVSGVIILSTTAVVWSTIHTVGK